MSVIVVGAGPVGLCAAVLLRQAGIDVLVLESRDSIRSNLTRAFMVHPATLELFDIAGLVDALLERKVHAVDPMNLFDGATGSLRSVQGRFRYTLVTPQYEVERILFEAALDAGVDIRWSSAVTNVQDRDGHVAVTTQDGTIYQASYVIGCDGTHSAVRRLRGIPYRGQQILRNMTLADVRFARPIDPRKIVRRINGGARGGAFVFIAPFEDPTEPDALCRVVAWSPSYPDTDPSREEIDGLVRQALRADYGMGEPTWMSRFDVWERRAERFLDGAVILAGDAAHCHSPAGGWGMNIGLADAYDAVWRIVMVLLEDAPATLLDGYNTERINAAEAVIHSSGKLTRLITIRSRPGRALRSAIAAGLLRIPAVEAKMAHRIAGIGLVHPAPPGAHRLVGTRVPDQALSGGTRLYEQLRGNRFVVLHPGSMPADVAAWGRRVSVHAHPSGRGPTMLIRPDRYVAYASEEPNAAGLLTALRQWCGVAIPTVGS